ncbi:MAG: YciI family protein [Methylococcales bacterium]|nr:YciI family protein [Methylococcales bacterium]
MLYAIMSNDVENSLSKRQAVRPAHLQRLQDLQDQGRLLLAGPHPTIESETPGDAGFNGSLVIAEFETGDDARAWADADPYALSGVYSLVTVKPFKQVFPQ